MTRDEMRMLRRMVREVSRGDVLEADALAAVDQYAEDRAKRERARIDEAVQAERERIAQAIEADADAVPRDVEHEPPLERGHRYGEVDALRRAARIARAES